MAARNLTIVLANDSNVNQTWSIGPGGKQTDTISPEETLDFVLANVTGDKNIPLVIDVNDNDLSTALLYTYSSNSWSLFPASQYLQLTGFNTGAEVACTYTGEENSSAASIDLEIKSLAVKPRKN